MLFYRWCLTSAIYGSTDTRRSSITCIFDANHDRVYALQGENLVLVSWMADVEGPKTNDNSQNNGISSNKGMYQTLATRSSRPPWETPSRLMPQMEARMFDHHLDILLPPKRLCGHAKMDTCIVCDELTVPEVRRTKSHKSYRIAGHRTLQCHPNVLSWIILAWFASINALWQTVLSSLSTSIARIQLLMLYSCCVWIWIRALILYPCRDIFYRGTQETRSTQFEKQYWCSNWTKAKCLQKVSPLSSSCQNTNLHPNCCKWSSWFTNSGFFTNKNSILGYDILGFSSTNELCDV